MKKRSNNFQAQVCDPIGIDCTRKKKADKDKCQIPCEGIYADIRKKEVDIVDETTPGMEEIFKAYEKYKNQFSNITMNPPGKYT